jgi:hypothetical protein
MRFLKRFYRWRARQMPARQLSAQRARDCALVSAALVGLLASTIGVPILERGRKGGDQAFPCQGRACGCATADACWRGCCCTSPSQRLAWAKAHGVRPPDALVALAGEQRSSDPAFGDTQRAARSGAEAAAGSAHKACCHSNRSSVAKQAAPSPPVSSRPARGEQEPQTLAPPPVRPHVAWIIGSLVSNCRGQTLAAGGAIVAVPPTPAVCWSFDWSLVERLPATREQFTSFSFPPPVPPPRA